MLGINHQNRFFDVGERREAFVQKATRAPLIWVVPGITRAGGVCRSPVDLMSVFSLLCNLTSLSGEDFGDIELLIEYKTGPGADSGIYLLGTPQIQIWDWNQPDDPKKPDRRPRLGSGGLFNNTPNTPGRDPSVHADRPFGEWNKFRIRQLGARTWVWLNERLVVDGAEWENFWDRTKPLPAKGPLMLQTHGGEIRWRNIFVRDIPPGEGAK